MENLQFKVDLRGIINLLSEHIYSTPKVFIRELLQNATDAIQALKLYDETFLGEIIVKHLPAQTGEIHLIDNGIGLTEAEINEFLVVIGESSKRNNLFEDSFIGRFGVGLLSCFVVSETIEIHTKSRASENGYIWKAKAEGTYSLETTKEPMPYGTSVIVKAKPEMRYYFQDSTVKELLKYYGEALPFPIHFQSEKESLIINPEPPVWFKEYSPKESLLEYGKQIFKQDFIDAFHVEIQELGLKGTAFIASQKRNINSKNESKVYVKRMLLSEKIENLLPNWGFFITTIFNIDHLTPTASRENFVQDATFKACKELLASFFKEYLKDISLHNPETFIKVLDVHYQSIKMLANEDDNLLEIFMDYLVFETNKGRKNFLWIKENVAQIFYTSSLEDYKQIRRIAHAKDIFLINAAYSFEEELMKNITRKYPELPIEKISPFDILKEFESLTQQEQNTYHDFIKKASQTMQKHFCEIALKRFFPKDVPVLFIGDEESINNYQTKKLTEDPSNPFATIIEQTQQKNKPTICFNINNELILQLVEAHQNKSFPYFIELLYVQSLFLGQIPVNKKEMDILNSSLLQITSNTLK